MTISEDGKIPPTIPVKCPNCGRVSSIGLKYSDGATLDYEGTCTGSISASAPERFCNTAILITYTIPEEPDRDPVKPTA